MLKGAPNLLFIDSTKKYLSRSDYEPVNVELVTLQIVLSKILTEILMLKGGNLLFYDVVNFNKTIYPIEVQNFFILMEVYGYQFPINYFDPNVSPLAMQRRRS